MAELVSRGAPSIDASGARRATPFGLSMTVAGRYRRGACIAKGGSSSVHRAVELTGGAEVALKSFHVHRAFDPELLPSLARGREIAAQVGPDVLVPILDVGADDDGTPFVVMPLVAGETLGARLEREEPCSPREALVLGRALLRSLDALACCGVTHGDLTPDNVLVRADGAVLLLDHEGLGAVGDPRPSRLTEGYGEPGGLREASDDHRALVHVLAALTARTSPPLEAPALAAWIDQLRAGELPEAAATLGWTLETSRTDGATPVRHDMPSRRWPWIVGVFLVTLMGAALWWAMRSG